MIWGLKKSISKIESLMGDKYLVFFSKLRNFAESGRTGSSAANGLSAI
jgi:hypothetical protein